MSHQPSYTCTIPYFVFFSKEEMCLDAIFRYFFSFFVIFTLFWHQNVLSQDPAEPLFFQHVPIKTQNDLKELSKLSKLFLESPLRIYICYYLGRHDMALGSYFNAIHHFGNSETLFYRFSENKTIKSENMHSYEHIVIQSLLYKADAFLELASKAEGMQKDYFFSQVANTFKALQRFALQKEDEMSYYLLNEHYKLLSKNQIDHDHLLELTQNQDFYKNPFLAKLYFDIGAQFFQKNDVKEALAFYQAAGNAQLQNEEDLLSIWVQQSLCLRQLGQDKEALLVLAKVINSPIPSSLRLRAMCMRASIYEDQQRHELAKKQWESIANKSGRWAKLAKQKLQ